MMTSKNICDNFYPCITDIDKAQQTKAFSVQITTLDELKLKFREVDILKDAFSEDVIDSFTEEYFKYVDQIIDLHKAAKYYLYPNIAVKPLGYSETELGEKWENTVHELYERYLMSDNVLFNKYLYTLLLHDFLWNPSLDPRNPKIQSKLIDNIVKIKTVNNLQLNESIVGNVIGAVKTKLHKIKVDVDDDGSILIKKNYSADLFKVFDNSAKLMKIYRDNNNLDKIKSELAKIFYINELIETKYIYNEKLSDTEKKEYKKYRDLRSRVLSSFRTYTEFIMKHDKNFDFISYYEDSPYNQVFKLDNEKVKGIKKLIGALL